MAVEAKEYIEPVVIDRDAEQESDQAPEQAQEDNVVDIRQKIADDYQKKEYGIEDETEEEPEAEPDPEPKAEDKEPEPEPDNGKVEVVINGQRMMADKAKIEKAGGLENYQRNLASHMGLQELAKQRKMLEDDKKMFDEYVREQKQNLPAPDDSKPQEPTQTSEDRKEIIRQYHEAVYEGDSDKADSLMERLVDIPQQPVQPAQPTVNEEELEAKILTKLNQKQEQLNYQQSVQKAQEAFAAEYSDIDADPIAKSVANEKTKLLMRDYPDWTPQSIVMEAGRQTREWLQGARGQQEQAENTQAKIDAKAKQVSVEAGSTRSAPKPQPKPMTNSDYITQLRKDRGLE